MQFSFYPSRQRLALRWHRVVAADSAAVEAADEDAAREAKVIPPRPAHRDLK